MSYYIYYFIIIRMSDYCNIPNFHKPQRYCLHFNYIVPILTINEGLRIWIRLNLLKLSKNFAVA